MTSRSEVQIANAAGYRTLETILAGVALAFLFVGLAVCLQPVLYPTARQRWLAEIRVAVEQRRPEAVTPAKQYLDAYPDDVLGLALAAKSASEQGLHETAISLFQRLPRDQGRWEFFAELSLARKYSILGKAAEAERHLRRALELSPDHLEANERLGHLLQVEGRTWESAPHFFAQIQKGKCRGDELLAVAVTERFFRGDEQLEQVDNDAGNPEVVMKLGVARRRLYENRTAEAEGLLRDVIAARPDLGEAQGRLGRIIVDRDDVAEFLLWRGGLPEEARDHPEVWFCQGLEARRMGQIEGAAACFLEALIRSPNHLAANVQIASCLERLGRSDAAQEFSRRGELLSELEGLLNLVRGNVDATLMSQVVTNLGKLGRYWEAAGWCHVMSGLTTATEASGKEKRHWLKLARAERGPDAPSRLPSRLLNRRDFAAPRWPAPPAVAPRESIEQSVEPAWNIVDDAERLGIRFEYYEGTSEENRLRHIFNVVGGGLGVLDYDGDGWPDLYLAQANNWRDEVAQPGFIDRLFRNIQGERYQDVTVFADLNETGFSHGVTVGDYDQDGFPDLYVGNKGPNRLFRNNGDGTFVDTTHSAGVAGNEWTTSSVFADFNNDGLPDLYVLNYTLLEETARKECHRGSGEPMACTPDVLIAEPDRLYLNHGDGSFGDVSSSAGVALPTGKGLGVVVWDFAGDGRLGIFVANDTTPNFLFMNTGADANGIPRFQEEGVVRGVAFNIDGNAQASMGVAAGDANGDGRIDLYITTFFGDTKTLYSQRDDRYFDDLTRPYNLRDSGFWMLGFGCQFADLDGDGWDDLIVTNGHVDQTSARGDIDRMPPQVLHNQRGRRFVEVPDQMLGRFFQNRYLGRGLATLDWNRDGRADVGISHIHAPFALLTNRTAAASQPLVVRLIGRSGCREPTGAVIRMSTGLTQETRLQTAGDGYLVTNERRHHFAVPLDAASVELEVRWPGGTTERWAGIPANREIVLIEGRREPVLLRNYSDMAPELAGQIGNGRSPVMWPARHH
jgi:tetratricopeptide (TPR) repeat protein